MNICKLQRATPSARVRPSDGSQISQVVVGRSRGRNVLVIITMLARSSSSQLASTFGQTREICIKADEDENEHEEAEEDKL